MPTIADAEAAPPPAYFVSQPEPPPTTRYEDGLDQGNVWGEGVFDEPTSETSPLLGSASPRRRQRLSLNLNRRNTLAFIALLGIFALTVFNLVHLVSYSSLQSSIAASQRQLGDIHTEVAAVELRRAEETHAFKVEQVLRSDQREKEIQQWDAERRERKEQRDKEDCDRAREHERENQDWATTRRQRQEQQELEDQKRALDHQRENDKWEAERQEHKERMAKEDWDRAQEHERENQDWAATRRQRQEQNEIEDRKRALDHQHENEQWEVERRERKEQRDKEDWDRAQEHERENEDWTATRRQRQEQNESEDRQRSLDHQRENEQWEAEQRDRLAQRERETEEWEQERQRRAEEDERDETSKRDAEKRAEMHLWWDSPRYAPHCAAWGAREYTAQLHNIADGYDPIRACEHTPVVVHENVVNKPDWCEIRDGVWGHWTVHFKEKWCEPWWNTFEDKGCIGRNKGFRQFYAKLEGVAKGEDHYLLCTTAPASIGGTHFDKPTHCFDHDWAMWGVWEIRDNTC